MLKTSLEVHGANRTRFRSRHFLHTDSVVSAMEVEANESVPLRLCRYPDVLLRHPRRCCSLDRRGSRGRLGEVMDVEDYRSQLILRKVKPSGLENGSRRSRLAHGCRKNQDERLGGLISRERRGQRFANNYGVEERVVAARDCSSFESREALARRDPRGNSALWIGYP